MQKQKVGNCDDDNHWNSLMIWGKCDTCGKSIITPAQAELLAEDTARDEEFNQ